ncbi:snRNA-activating protein complex subunit 4 isoform X2 [Mugil cephalus]|uniref:snRNA-activating protein complex subunit 4 isoform X2 n=1 Tax=Mugil cephalus TaxID=48193 RepID=UPI001FB7C139|nr:snRNA-activating protein complex subunit 4 isoform X2 [Mugil cephalus]
MSVSLSAKRDRIQRQVDELEQSLSASHTEMEQLSSETDDGSDSEDVDRMEDESAAGLLVQRQKIQKEIQNLEDVLGPHSPLSVSDEDSSSDESDLGLSMSVDSCLQMNLVYQQVVQETLDQLEKLLTLNQRQQKELVSQMCGPVRETSRDPPHSSYQQPVNMYLGRFLKPYFKDKLTGLGPPANQEAKEKASRTVGCLDDRKLKMKRWESWQKTLLIHSVSTDSLKRLIQPKLSRVDYLSQKMSSAEDRDKQQLREQIDSLEKEIDLIRGKKEEELIGDRFEEHDWQKISNIDFEGTRDAEDIRCFWQNFLHPSINKTRWSKEEVQHLKDVSRRHGDRHWVQISEELETGRTAFMCLQMFQRFVSVSLKRGSWTPTEDALLRELVDKMRIGNFIPYTQMSYFMEGRDPAQLIYRWNQVLDPSLKRGPWTKEEDQLLLSAVSRFGEKNWWKIRLEVPGRTDSACRDRYHDCLKEGMKRGLFDQQEKDLLQQLVDKHGVGRWAKIAAEIPHRTDAQCLREWRRLIRRPQQKAKRGQQTKETSSGKRGRLKTLMEEEEEEEEVEYMDSDDEKKKKKKQLVDSGRTEEEQEYVVPPMKEWVPVDRVQSFSFLSFCPVALPSSSCSSSSSSSSSSSVRSTIAGPFGRSVVVGPAPRVLKWEERHGSGAMMMVSPDQLRAHLTRQANQASNQVQAPGGRRRVQLTDAGLDYMLQAAVTPWIGNLLIPVKSRVRVVDRVRERAERSGLTSTPLFLLLLRVMSVDATGCKEVIERRKRGTVLLTPPPDPAPLKVKNPKTVAGILQQRKLMKPQNQNQNQAGPMTSSAPPRPPPPPPPPLPVSVVSILQNVSQNLTLPPHPFQSRTGPRAAGPRRIASPNEVAKAEDPRNVLILPLPVQQLAPPPSLTTPIPMLQTPPLTTPPLPVQAPPPSLNTPSGSVLAPPIPALTNRQAAASSSDSTPSHPSPVPKGQGKKRGRGRGEELSVLSSQDNQSEGRTRPGETQEPKRVRKPSQKARALQEVQEAKSVSRRKRTSPGPQVKRSSGSAGPVLNLLPAQSMWLMTPSTLVQVADAPSQVLPSPSQPLHAPSKVLQVAPAPSQVLRTPYQPLHAPSQVLQVASAPSRALCAPSQVVLVPPPPFQVLRAPSQVRQVAPSPSQVPQVAPSLSQVLIPTSTLPPPPVPTPLKRVGVPAPCPPPTLSPPPPPRMEAVPFDPSLMFLEPEEEVCDWLNGRGGVTLPGGGVALPGGGVALPYLPPFVSSLCALSLLLRAKKALTKSSLQLLIQGSEPRPRHVPLPKTRPDHTKTTSSQRPPDLPDSTSDPQPAMDPPAPSASTDPAQQQEEEEGENNEEEEEEEEEEKVMVAAVRHLVAERFSGNPAYQLLKARFLSCFTVPALLATIQPITGKIAACTANQKEQEEEEQEEQEEEEVKKIKERARQRRRGKTSSLLCDSSRDSAALFSGIIRTSTDQTRPEPDLV